MLQPEAQRANDLAVSIVMPTLNQAVFIEQSVRSVMSQGIDGLELVVADGGSTDGTQDTLAALAAEFPGRLRWWSAADGGPAQAVNTAVAQARGPVIGWLNSDDLYAPGAVRRALDHLAREPAHVMVYGEAEHIDVNGAFLARYPTRLPATPLAEWADGCHICQPTAFFRRRVFTELGGLDASLRAAFDFDLWLRLLKVHPGAAGFVPEVQARSRLHDGAITMRMRERVALEGLRVVHRHLGAAPPHWMLSHFAEVKAQHPFQPPHGDLVVILSRLADAALPWLLPGGDDRLRAAIAHDRAVQLASAHLYATLEPDGWAGRRLEVRLRQPAQPLRCVRLHCHHAAPRLGRLRLSISGPDGLAQSKTIGWRRRFTIELPVTGRQPDAQLRFHIGTDDVFVPAEVVAGSDDRRALAFLVERIETEPATT